MSETATWQPSASIPNLLKRAAIIAEIRRFFADRGVLEVETPCMSQATVTDIHLFPFETRFVGPGHSQGMNLYLMTSPEYHMKRLLVAGCGPVYQLCRSFRNEEMGRHHNPEFTMLEWYRPHYDMYRLMNEVDDLLQQVLDCSPAESLSYQQAFQRHLEIDPLSADKTQLREVAAKLDLSNIADTEEDRDTLLQLLFTMGVEPHIGKDKPTFVYHFPASQASLAQISTEDHRVAERFEVYYKGIELANGFHELTDAREQQQRFEQDNRKRAARGLPQQPIDTNLLEALKVGMPDCSGVALGVDRLVMLALGVVMLGIIIYLAFRFEWKFGVSAAFANFHDVVIILGFFAFFQWEFSLSVLAGVLAVLGYSVNESVVVFDRIREKFRKTRNISTPAVIDHAITSTMSRTIITHASTEAVVLAMLFFGGPSLHYFALALTIGIVFGIYSSIFVGSALVMWLGVKREDLVKTKKESHDPNDPNAGAVV